MEPESRTARKRRAIVEAATEAFLRGGYRGTSMDEIAAAASVSKQTVYKAFLDKERLFAAVVTATVAEAADPVHAGATALRDTGDLAADLHDLARRQLALVLRPRLLRLRRLVIAEAERFPALGAMFHSAGPQRTIAALAETFAGLAARGLLRVPDPVLAATQFNWLVMGEPLNRAMLLGPLDETEFDRVAAAAVGAFLAVYQVR